MGIYQTTPGITFCATSAPSLEGDVFYDGFGSLITRGWLIYDWRQVQPRIAESSQIFKASQYMRWFNRQLLAVDSKGDYSFSILVGDETQYYPDADDV